MTKKEIIEKYGEEEYQRRLEHIKQHQQQHKEEYKQYKKQYYQQHKEEYRQWSRKKRYMFAYCIPEQIEQIENYELAKKDNFQGWNIHHKLETHNADGSRREVDLSREELIAMDMYYNRPASELIFMRAGEHISLHRKGGNK